MKLQKGYFKTYQDSVGHTLYDLTVLGYSHKDFRGNHHMKCVCSCGKEIIKTFSEINKISISKSCGCKKLEIYRNAGKANRKYSINKHKLVDNNETAYIAGLLGADGYKYKSKNLIGIALNKKDLKLLQNIKEYLEYDGKILSGSNDSLRLDISDPNFINFFSARGIVCEKTTNFTVPNIYKFNPNFWRGFIDGDGCVYNRKEGIGLTLSGLKWVIEDYKNFCNSIIDCSKNKLSKRDKKEFYRFDLSTKKAMKVLEILYKNKEIYMERKYEIFRKHQLQNTGL